MSKDLNKTDIEGFKRLSSRQQSALGVFLQEAIFFVFLGLFVFLLMVMLSYSPHDPGFSTSAYHGQVQNVGGATGAWVASFLLYTFGVFGYLLPFGFLLVVWFAFKVNVARDIPWDQLGSRFFGLLLWMLSGAGLAAIYTCPGNGLAQACVAEEAMLALPHSGGGVIGYELAKLLQAGVDRLATTLVLSILFMASVSVMTGLSWLTIMEVTGYWLSRAWQTVVMASDQYLLPKRDDEKRTVSTWQSHGGDHKTTVGKGKVGQWVNWLVEPKVNPSTIHHDDDKTIGIFVPSTVNTETNEAPHLAPPLATQPLIKHNTNRTATSDLPFVYATEDLPSLSLLQSSEDAPQDKGASEAELQAMADLLEKSLQEYNIKVSVKEIVAGPVVTRFEVLPAPGVKVSQISGLSRDLARSLSIESLRVVEVIPGKSYIGLEVANDVRQMVNFHDLLLSKAYQSFQSPLALALGRDIANEPVVADLAKMPHLLVAGTTGSGKSVGINAMIMSMLFKATPAELRFIMIDPKMLELSIYEDIPHLLTPVVTDMKEAHNSLKWCVYEMERRYRLMSAIKTRKLSDFNRIVQGAIDDGEPMLDPLFKRESNDGILDEAQAAPTLEPLPFIVLIIDEFADMMMTVGKQVEELIARLTQKARAAGIHVILATQRPSVNVVTGLIKSNIPTRLSFQVSSKIDSRTILDQMGAEQLLGNGDMLYLPSGRSEPDRVHGPFVSDEEVIEVVKYLKSKAQPDYIAHITQEMTDPTTTPSNEPSGQSGNGLDPLFDEALQLFVDTNKVSISSLQRKLNIGFNRAARIVDQMEEEGVVSGAKNGQRQLLSRSGDLD